MPVSDIDICNMALGHLGRSAAKIQSFAEKSVEARVCSLWYDPSRREVLEAQDWSFARKRLTLALHSDAAPDEWAYRYQTPSDSLAIRSFWNPFSNSWVMASAFGNFWPGFAGALSDAIPYELEASLDGQEVTILTNLTGAIIRYTWDNPLVQMFSPLFVHALSHYMAAKMALEVTGKAAFEDKETKAFQIAMRAASASDANQHVEPPLRDGSSIRARL
jgi:hypothetical protein